MKNFGLEYASVYDYLYQDKDYEKECDFIESIFKNFSHNVKSILDLGCGTGSHAIILAKRGYKIIGVDKSSQMIEIAKRKAKSVGVKIDFYINSIQKLHLDEKFDAVISIFAVMSYQVRNHDLALACKIARKHLKSGGIFIFDVWNGFAVISDPPVQKIKEINNNNNYIIRITTPKTNLLSHTVDVNFKVLKIKKGSIISETQETHKMRFVFPQEIKYFLQIAGFSQVSFCPFLNLEKPLTEKDWNMCVIARV